MCVEQEEVASFQVCAHPSHHFLPISPPQILILSILPVRGTEEAKCCKHLTTQKSPDPAFCWHHPPQAGTSLQESHIAVPAASSHAVAQRSWGGHGGEVRVVPKGTESGELHASQSPLVTWWGAISRPSQLHDHSSRKLTGRTMRSNKAQKSLPGGTVSLDGQGGCLQALDCSAVR